MKKETKILIANTFMWILAIIWLGIALDVYTNITPYPEQEYIGLMSKDMLAMGQQYTLFCIYFNLGIFCALTFVSAILTFVSIYNYVIYSKLCNFEYDETVSKGKRAGYYIAYGLLYTISIPLGLFTCLGIWIQILVDYIKTKKQNQTAVSYQTVKLRKNTKVALFSSLTLLPLTAAGITAVAYCFSPKMDDTNQIPNAFVTDYLTLSNTHPNTISLYFDRSPGIDWNLLLKVDELVYKDKSFIHQFPEFTSYLNTISLSKLTKISNPVIYAGYLFSPILKEFPYHNFFDPSVVNTNLTLDDWYFNALKTQADMYAKYGITNVGYNNLPYFTDNNVYESLGNMPSLNEWFAKNGMQNPDNKNGVYKHIPQ